MNSSVILYGVIFLVSVFASSISQVMLKKSANKKYESFIQEYTNPLVITAYVIFFGTTLLTMLAYKGIPLSMGPILEATSYVYITFFGVKIFDEKINRKKIVALFLIILGIIVYSA